MASSVTFKILEDIARDLSGNEITFPTFLDITFQVRAALKDPNLSVEQLAKLVGAEPLMSAKIIRMANSVAMNPSVAGRRGDLGRRDGAGRRGFRDDGTTDRL